MLNYIFDENGKSYGKIELIYGDVLNTLNDYYVLKNEL